MNITKENVDALNAVITVDIATEDYQTKVTEVLQNYRKKADVPGFRKGYVPIGMVKKQYGKSVMIDEVNKLLQESLNNFLIEEELYILGSPLLIIKDDFSWDTETFSFKFELGLVPKFTVDLSLAKNKITQNNVIADDNLIDDRIENLRYDYGESSYLDKATKTSEIMVSFSFNGGIELDIEEIIYLENVKEQNLNKFLGAKIDEAIEFEIKDLSDDDELAIFLEMYEGDIPESKATLIIKEIIEIELAELNQDFFDEEFPDGSVKSVTEFRSRIKEDYEIRFKEQADRQLLVDITKFLVKNTKFDLPAEFLQKLLLAVGDNLISKEQVADEYAESEEDLRRQLIEGKILKDNNITIYYQELAGYTKELVKTRMTKFGNTNYKEEDLNNFVGRILGNRDEAERLQEELISKKLITFYKDNIIFKTKEVSYTDLIKETYQ